MQKVTVNGTELRIYGISYDAWNNIKADESKSIGQLQEMAIDIAESEGNVVSFLKFLQLLNDQEFDTDNIYYFSNIRLPEDAASLSATSFFKLVEELC